MEALREGAVWCWTLFCLSWGKEVLWSQSTLMMEQRAREFCVGGTFTDGVELGERTGLRTTGIHPEGDRPTEHLEEVVRQRTLLTSYLVTLYGRRKKRNGVMMKKRTERKKRAVKRSLRPEVR